jgi:hypothetical protein
MLENFQIDAKGPHRIGDLAFDQHAALYPAALKYFQAVRLREFLHGLQGLGVGLEGEMRLAGGYRALPLVRAVPDFMELGYFDVCDLRAHVDGQLDEFVWIDAGHWAGTGKWMTLAACDCSQN